MSRPPDVEDWIENGLMRGETHVIVVHDMVVREDYPIYARGDEAAAEAFRTHNGVRRQRVREVYDLRMNIEAQLKEERPWHLPAAVRRRRDDPQG